MRVPALDFLTMLDVLNVLRCYGPLSFTRELDKLRILRNRVSLSTYLRALENLMMITRRTEDYRNKGAVRKKSIFAITTKGVYFLQSIEGGPRSSEDQ